MLRLSFLLCISFVVFSADEIVNGKNINSVSMYLAGEYFKQGDGVYEKMRGYWEKTDKTDEIINNIKGQDLQYKSKAVEHYGFSSGDQIILVGSKSLPVGVKILYIISTKVEFIPISFTWIVKGDSYRLGGVAWGMSQCGSDLSDLSVKTIGSIKGPLDQ